MVSVWLTLNGLDEEGTNSAKSHKNLIRIDVRNMLCDEVVTFLSCRVFTVHLSSMLFACADACAQILPEQSVLRCSWKEK